jgi:pyrroloquinoline quinone (PQQ) biosynthesis protein C
VENRPIERSWTPRVPDASVDPIDPSTRLAVCKHVRLTEKEQRISRIDLGGRVLALDAESGERATRLLRHADGSRTLAEIAQALDWPLDEAIDAAQDLYLLAVLKNVGDTPVPALTFSTHLDNYVKAVQVRMSESIPSLLEALEKKPSRRLLLGALVENYHYVAAAASHISPAIAKATDENLQMMFSEYLSGEFWHGRWLKQGLLAAGLTDGQIDGSDPLPSTLATVNCMRWFASTDLLAYSACLAAGELEGGAKAAERTSKYFDALVKLGLVAAEVVEPFRQHALEDCSADHHSYASEAFVLAPPLTRAQQDAIRRAVLQYQRAVGEQQLQIVQFYGGPGETPFFSADP